MEFKPEMTVAEIAGAVPQAIPVFQKHGIDFCCGGRRELEEVCRERGVAFAELAGELERALRAALPGTQDWTAAPLGALIDHILDRYHKVLREELPRLDALAEKVAAKHGPHYPDALPPLLETFRMLENELLSHMEKEERVLFPHVRDLEHVAAGSRPPVGLALGLAAGATGVMEQEHESAGLALKTIRRLTGGFRPPDDACGSFRALYAGLELFESDLMTHVHLENNILFPRAVELEEAAVRRIRG